MIRRPPRSTLFPYTTLSRPSAASTSSHDWKRAASVKRAGTPGSSIRSEVGSSSTSVHLRHVEPVHARGVPADDLRLLVFGHPGQNLREDLARPREGGFAVRIVRAPHHVVHADRIPQT